MQILHQFLPFFIHNYGNYIYVNSTVDKIYVNHTMILKIIFMVDLDFLDLSNLGLGLCIRFNIRSRIMVTKS